MASVSKILCDIADYKHILIMGDIDDELLKMFNNGQSISFNVEPVRMYLTEYNCLLTFNRGFDENLIAKCSSLFWIALVCNTVSYLCLNWKKTEIGGSSLQWHLIYWLWRGRVMVNLREYFKSMKLFKSLFHGNKVKH